MPRTRKTPRDLHGRLVVVTGGGRGIGLATARRFADAGARVVIGDLDADVAEEAARSLDGAHPVRGLALDVTDRASYAAFLERAGEHGPVEVLVNNAGIMPLGPLAGQDEESIDRVLEVNLRAVITGTRLVLPIMAAAGRGHVINVASAVGRVGMAGGAVYSASKFGVVGFSEATLGELAPLGVDVSCVLPTVVATELSTGVSPPRGMRACTPDEVADAILGVARRPRFETWVPGYAKGVFHTSNTLPRRARDLLGHLMHADSSLTDVDARARAAYEQRAAR